MLLRNPPLCEQLYDRIREFIFRSPPGKRLESERSLATRFSVSRPTVRCALAKLEEEGLVERRQGEGTLIAQRTSGRLVKVLFFHKREGLKKDDHVYARCLREIEAVLREGGHRTVIVETPKPKEQVAPPAENVREGGTADMLVTLGIMDSEYIRGLAEFGVPIVAVDYDAATTYADAIAFDSFGAGLTLTEHLVSLGHKRIAYLGIHRGMAPFGPKPEGDSLRLRAGFECAMQEHGFGVRRDWDLVADINFTGPAGDAARKLLEQSPRPSAFVCRLPAHALAVIKAAEDIGLGVPEDLGVACFGQEEEVPKNQRALTTVTVNMEEMGREAGRVILSRLESGEGPRLRIAIPGSLLVRNTTGRPRD